MATKVRETLASPIDNFNQSWDEGHTGQEVEDFITRKLIEADDNLIVSATFADLILTLNKKGANTSPVEVQVIIAKPTYTYNIFTYGLVLNGDYNNIIRQTDSLITLYNSGKTFHLGVALIAYADTVGNINDLTAAQPITVDFNGKLANYNVVPLAHDKVLVDGTGVITGFTNDVNPVTDIAWLDVTPLFTARHSGKIKSSYSIEMESGGVVQLFTGSSELKVGNIINEVVNLSYGGSIVTNSSNISFTTDSDNSNYKLEGWVYYNNTSTVINSSSLSYDGMQPGLNQYLVRAVNKNNPQVCTDYITVDIIYAPNQWESNGAIAAINNVHSTIANNGVATLYDLTVYSSNGLDETVISSYISDQEYDNPNNLPISTLVKQDIITDTSYTQNDGKVFTSNYQKYMEFTGGGQQFLYVKVDNTWYKFLISEGGRLYTQNGKNMTIEPLDINLTYVSEGVYKSFDQIGGCLNDIFKTKTYYPNDHNINPALEVSDGWIEEGGRNIFRVSSLNAPVFTKNFPSQSEEGVTLQLQDQFTLEFGFKSYNISNEASPILTIGNLQLRPTQLCWNVNKSGKEEELDNTFTARNSQFLENTETHIVLTVAPTTINSEGIYYPDYLDQYATEQGLSNLDSLKINLVRIFVNGVIDREFILEQSEVNNLKSAYLQINPKGCDVDFYVLRVYNLKALKFTEVQKNYISFLKLKESKLKFYNDNNILIESGSRRGEISFNKCLGKYNTIVYVLPAGQKKIQGTTNDTGRFPNRAWGYADNSPEQDNVMKSAHVSIFVNYADPDKNSTYGGRINHLRIKSQGSSAERYLIWNVGSAMDKFKDGEGKKIKSIFTPYSLLGNDNRFTANGSKNCYIMPTYEGEVDQTPYEAKKLVGKVNFASSMQSHKLGACKLFDDAFKSAQHDNMPLTVKGADYGSKKAVHEEAFLYFYWEPNMTNDEVANCDLADIIDAGSNVKFMGFQTWGPGKGDKAYFGYSNNTPEYILIEGDENKDQAANFRVPWHALQRATHSDPADATLSNYDLTDSPTISYEEGLADSTKNLVIFDENICYRKDNNVFTGAFAVDFGLEDDPTLLNSTGSESFWKFKESVKESVNKFRRFHDFVYKYDYTYVVVDENHNNPAEWSPKRKYCVISSEFPYLLTTYPTLSYTHTAGDLYRYETYTKKWVPAGVKFDITTGKWASANVKEISGVTTLPASSGSHRDAIKDIFTNQIGNYINVDDIAFHQAFVRFLSGTDNRAKNTYYQIVGPLYRTDKEVKYTQEEVDIHNSELTGAISTATLLTAEQAATLNEIEGVSSSLYEVGQLPTAEDAALYNSKLDGAISTSSVKIPAQTVIDTQTDDSYKVRLLGDDLDTILVTDNNGKQSKPYNLLEPSYDESLVEYWGDDHNLFYYMFDQCFEGTIRGQLNKIMDKAFGAEHDVTLPGTYFYNQFFSIQEKQFPAVAYNHTAKIYYENAQFIKQSGIIGPYGNNNVDNPVSQSHGSCVACEKQFMQKRFNFLRTYTKVGVEGSWNLADSAGSGVTSLKLKIKFTPYQDFYPTYYWGTIGADSYIGVLDNKVHTYQDKDYYMPVVTELYEDSDTRYDTLKYLAKEGEEYEVTINEDNPAINAAISSISLYKSMSITGMPNSSISTATKLSHITDLSMDNNLMIIDEFFNGRNPMRIDNFNPDAPVLETLELKNISLPLEIDLSDYTKLKKIDFSGSNVTHVIFPLSGRLQTAILPDSITDFRIYNNPGILATNVDQGIVLADPSKLKTIYINGANSGQFDVSQFCTDIKNATLDNVTLRNINITITEEVLKNLLDAPNCIITGTITVVNDNGTLAEISYGILQKLVDKFGDIRPASNGTLKVSYKDKPVTLVRMEPSISLYKVGDTIKVTPNLDGNKIEIIPDTTAASGYRLNISYYLLNSRNAATPSTNKSNFDSRATMNSMTGEITLGSSGITDNGYVFIYVKPSDSSNRLYNTGEDACEVSFSWKAPQIGDFAYADGSFSASFMPSKDYVGLVYAVKPDDAVANKGTAYIIGKEYAFKNPESNADIAVYSGLTTETGSKIGDSYEASAYFLNQYANNVLSYAGSSVSSLFNMLPVSSLSSIGAVTSNSLVYGSYNPNNTDNFTGKSDTDNYIRVINSKIIPALRSKYASNSVILENTDNNQIESTLKLYRVYNELLRNKFNELTDYHAYSQFASEDLATAIIFPYIYAMKVYQPTASSLKSQYRAGNWYMPSLAQLLRVIYFRGLSARDSDSGFDTPQYAMLPVVSRDTTNSMAIFSKAAYAMRMSTSIPECWRHLLSTRDDLTVTSVSSALTGPDNLVTAMSSSGNNFGYQNTTDNTSDQYSGSNNYNMKWVSGQQPVYNEGNWSYIYHEVGAYPGSTTVWALYSLKHKGIPFVEYIYDEANEA